MNKKEYTIEIGGDVLTAEFSDLVERANGSVILRYGDTVVLSTAVMSPEAKEGMNWFPLTVDYEEKFYAAGQILGSRFMRREGRPSDDAILTGRVVDRTIRPLFDQSSRNEIQVVATVLSLNKYDPDILAVNATSLALATSDIPWNGPASAVRIVKHIGKDEFIVNPTYDERMEKDVELDLVACGKDGNINMIEIGSKEVSEEVVAKALEKASEEIEKFQAFQKMIIAEIGKQKQILEKQELAEEAKELFKKEVAPKLYDMVFSGPGNTNIYALKDEWKKLYKERLPEGNQGSLAGDFYEDAVNDLLHSEAIQNNKRADGRPMDQVRDIYTQAGGLSDTVHGSGIFYRGGTHVLSVLTLGGPDDSLLLNSIESPDEQKRFMHHYNFPPFSVGEVGRIGGMNRRMIGHGALAEKALIPVLPPKEEFPYTIRIVSESMASNGSTSMASACGSTLALMDAGVPISAPVAGIAMGLMMQDEQTYKVLTDIQGPEDHHGDMDFKVAGTRNGITAIQLDIKVDGVPVKILAEAMVDAKKAREHIINKIEEVLERPRPNLKPSAPKILTMTIKPDQIGQVIGSGGKTIKEIQETTGAVISIDDDGTVYVTGKDGSAEKALAMVEAITHEYKVGERYEGPVTKIFEFGALVEIGHKTEGLVHVSEIAPFRINNVEDVLSVGEIVPVIIKELGEQGKISLSIKNVDPEFVTKKGIDATNQKPARREPSHNNHGKPRRHER
jgi:polyribonucleotide nucleotidyltransferase